MLFDSEFLTDETIAVLFLKEVFWFPLFIVAMGGVINSKVIPENLRNLNLKTSVYELHFTASRKCFPYVP